MACAIQYSSVYISYIVYLQYRPSNFKSSLYASSLTICSSSGSQPKAFGKSVTEAPKVFPFSCHCCYAVLCKAALWTFLCNEKACKVIKISFKKLVGIPLSSNIIYVFQFSIFLGILHINLMLMKTFYIYYI